MARIRVSGLGRAGIKKLMSLLVKVIAEKVAKKLKQAVEPVRAGRQRNYG